MTLDDLPTIRIDSLDTDEIQKYIVAVVKKEDGTGIPKTVVWSKRLLEHSAIVSEIWEVLEHGDFDIDCLGGGKLRVNAKKKEIIIGDESRSFGAENDREATIKMLQEALPDYRFKEVTVLNWSPQ